jgi:succinate dehydrogenase/fumarate reductase flavoprotein subunit
MSSYNKSSKSEDQKPGQVTRRDFLRNAGIVGGAAAAVAGSGILAGCAANSADNSSGLPAVWDYECDILVAGAGNGGCSAFLKAVDSGANAMLIEISSVTGGSSLISGSQIHIRNLGDWESYDAYTKGRHDQVLGKKYVETFWSEYIPFLKSKNAVMEQPVPGNDGFGAYRMGSNIDPDNLPSENNVELGAQGHRDYFDSLINAATDGGGVVLNKTRAVKLYTDDQGTVVGLQACVWNSSPIEEDQKLINIKATKIILCTGNIYGNKSLMTQYVSPFADNVRDYGLNPYQMGDGLVMALEIGALAGGAFSSWSGGNQSVYPPHNRIATNPEKYEEFITTTDPKTWIQTLQDERPAVPFTTTNSIEVNLDGKRFSGGIVFQYLGVAFRIADKTAFDADPTSETKIKNIRAKGQTVYQSDTIEGLATALNEGTSMNMPGLINTIREFNEAIDNNTTDRLYPAMAYPATPFKIETPPFYAVEICSTMYYNMGGLIINENAQVLDRQRRPIANLYAAPPCAGGIMRDAYTGGIGISGTFGYLAAKHAAANL